MGKLLAPERPPRSLAEAFKQMEHKNILTNAVGVAYVVSGLLAVAGIVLFVRAVLLKRKYRLRLLCPTCGAKLSAPLDMLGLTEVCQECQSKFRITEDILA